MATNLEDTQLNQSQKDAVKWIIGHHIYGNDVVKNIEVEWAGRVAIVTIEYGMDGTDFYLLNHVIIASIGSRGGIHSERTIF